MDFMKKWFSYNHGSYQVYVIIQRRTIPSSTTDEAEETRIKEEKKIKKEVIEKESVVQEESTVRDDQDELDTLDAEIKAVDASLKHQLSQTPSPSHRTRRKYVIRENDKNRAAEYGPSGL
ncbi:hypothetical protein CBS147353_11712 [Aspergillus niger]|nr:hypothetical protein CBS147353_11712 [Aspergillus niger]